MVNGFGQSEGKGEQGKNQGAEPFFLSASY